MGRYLLDTHTAIWYFNGFDRLLIAIALDEQMSFISADKNIAQYDVPLIW
jgi:PIN domain nuclease of toxin-antitoxin system